MKGLAGVSLSNRSMKIPDHRESIFEPNAQFLCPWIGKDKNNNFYTLIIAYFHQTSRGNKIILLLLLLFFILFWQ